MTWTRTQLKEQAKEALQRNYWKIVLVSFLAALFCYGLPGAGRGHNGAAVHSDAVVETGETDISIEVPDLQTPDVPDAPIAKASQAVGITIFVVIALCAFALFYALCVLLVFPFHVGVNRFMLKSIDDTAQVREVTYGFDHSYKNVIKTMFHYDIRIFLWSLLFVIPGFYKQYQYRMVPYILAEHPDMEYKEVLQKSARMMEGHKWNAFVLDLSFILWHIGGLMTCGILEIFYVLPYRDLTCAALYRKLETLKAPAEPL